MDRADEEYVSAEALARRALRGFEQSLGADDTHTEEAHLAIGLAILGQRRVGDSIPFIQEAADGLELASGFGTFDTVFARRKLGQALLRDGQSERAAATLVKALKVAETFLGRENAETRECLYYYLRATWRTSTFDASMLLFEDLVSRFSRDEPLDQKPLASAHLEWGRACTHYGHPIRACEILRTGFEFALMLDDEGWLAYFARELVRAYEARCEAGEDVCDQADAWRRRLADVERK